MHFTISKDKVNYFHIEMWDSLALGDELVKKIESYKGKKLKDFLKFALKEQLFLKLRILYMMGNDETVYFWASPACLGSESANELMKSAKAFNIKNSMYAMIKLKMKGQDDSMMAVIVEDVLASIYKQLNYPVKEFILEATPEEVKDISIAFNISRNRQHMIRNIIKGMDKGFMQMQLKGVKYIGVKKDMSLEIMDNKTIKHFSKKDAENYVSIVPTVTQNKDEIKDIEETIDRLSKFSVKKETLKEKSEMPASKEKRKGFLSRIFKR